ncbi:pectate lyase, partial [Candidatus Latescibacterota bacterium]
NPYIGDGVKTEPTDAFASVHVGDETDTSPFRDESDTEYISTREFIGNMNTLINYVSSRKELVK